MRFAEERRGFALAEVIVAVTLLAFASAGLVGLLIQSADSLRRASATERSIALATEAMTRVSVWPREMLSANTGMARVDNVDLRIAPEGEDLFAIIAYDIHGATLLNTVLYRPSK